MTKLKKIIASLAACALMVSALALNVSAVTFHDFGNDVKADSSLTDALTSATASTTLNHTGGAVYVSIVGEYYAKGTTDIKTNTNGGGGMTVASASISNSGGTWIELRSTHTASYNGTTTDPYYRIIIR